jgi:Zn-dependent peptidase ImmA (M78 family)
VGHAPPHATTSIYTGNYTTSADANEAEANRLAADIIMPKEAVIAAMQEMQGGDEGVDALAQRFQVSRQAMEIRVS